jgi:hypothetical protein
MGRFLVLALFVGLVSDLALPLVSALTDRDYFARYAVELAIGTPFLLAVAWWDAAED